VECALRRRGPCAFTETDQQRLLAEVGEMGTWLKLRRVRPNLTTAPTR
jgi:hypothetical protein